MKGKNGILLFVFNLKGLLEEKHDKKNTSDRKDILFEKQAILLDIFSFIIFSIFRDLFKRRFLIMLNEILMAPPCRLINDAIAD